MLAVKQNPSTSFSMALNPNVMSQHQHQHDGRPHHASANNAIAAAEAAAQLILSDDPIRNMRLVRNRSSAGSTGSSSSNANNDSNSANNSGSAVEGGGSFLLRIHKQREGAMQRQQREKAFPLKTRVWVALFCVGVLFLSVGVHQEHQDQQNPGHRTKSALSKGGGGDAVNHHKGQRVGVPLPPNMERRYQNEKKPKLHSTEAEAAPKPKVISIENYANTFEPNPHRHAIPPTLIFTYHTDLLATPELDLVDEEDVALSYNVKRILSLHPQSSVRFLTDADCLQSIRAALGPRTNLTKYFTNEERGMYKADVCRGAALYELGGLYFDVDLEARTNLFAALAPGTKFATIRVHADSKHKRGFFQAFVGATPRHPVLKRYLELFVAYYEGRLQVNGPLGVQILRMAYDERGDAKTTELWQEIRYNPRSFPEIKRDHWGKRRACQMLVVAPPLTSKQFQRKQVVPLFSRANGSRMCGGKDTHKKG